MADENTPERMLIRRLRLRPDAAEHAELIAALEAMDIRMTGVADTYYEMPPEARELLSQERTRLVVAARDVLLALPDVPAASATLADPVPVYVQPTRYEVSLFPPGSRFRHHFQLTVEWRGEDRWAVLDGIGCLGTDGEWDEEPFPSSRSDEWLAAHRFDLETALRLARETAPKLRVNGRTAAEVAREAVRDEEAS